MAMAELVEMKSSLIRSNDNHHNQQLHFYMVFVQVIAKMDQDLPRPHSTFQENPCPSHIASQIIENAVPGIASSPTPFDKLTSSMESSVFLRVQVLRLSRPAFLQATLDCQIALVIYLIQGVRVKHHVPV